MSCSNPIPPLRSGPHLNDFIGLYKKAGDEGDNYDEFRKQERRKKGSKEPVDVSQINLDGSNLRLGRGGGSTPMNSSRISSTPRAKSKKRNDKQANIATAKVDTADNSLDLASSSTKKRSKSANASLKENVDLVVKKAKTEDTQQKLKKNKKKNKPDLTSESNPHKETIAEICVASSSKKRNKSPKSAKDDDEVSVKKAKTSTTSSLEDTAPKNKYKNQNTTNNDVETAEISVEQLARENKMKKKKKKSTIKPVIENLENLNIGHNTHTVTHLLDEMAVVDKAKKKKARKTINRNKKQSSDTTKENNTTKESSESTNKIEPDTGETKEVKKWGKKRWGKKGSTLKHNMSVVVENIPISILFTYKPILNDMFKEYGNVRTVGVAEVYPTEVSQPVFTTTVYFATPEAATKALEKDGIKLKGNKIRVNPSLPLDKTTLVMRSYGPLTEQSVVTMFKGAGRIRSIRPVIKGKKTMSTVFVDFDGPGTVESALARTSNLTLNNKKIIVDKFTFTNLEHKQKKTTTKAPDVGIDE